MEPETNIDQRPVIQASEILAKIQRGEDVEYDGVIVDGDLELSGLKLPTEHVERTEIEKHLELSDERRVIGSKISIANSEVRGEVDLSNARCLEPIAFNGVKFEGKASFQEAEFGGTADFGGSEFAGDASFLGARFSGDADLSESRFGGDASFLGARFSGDANFGGSRFGKFADFSTSVLGGGASFERAEFAGEADFEVAEFGGDADFSRAVLSGYANIQRAEFDGEADFSGAKFRGEAEFQGTQFGGDAKFQRAEFGGDADFEDAQFGKSADFSATVLGGSIRFGGAEFGGDADFLRARFDGEADFRGALFGGDADFGRALFKRTASFDHDQFDVSVSFKDTKFSDPASQELACRTAKRKMDGEGDKRESDYYFYREMEAKRMRNGIKGIEEGADAPPSLPSKIKRFLIYDVLERIFIQTIFGYGVRPFNVAKAWLIVVFALGLVYWIGSGVEKAGYALEWYEYFYFSIINAATPGYASYTPASGLYALIAGAQAIFGTFMVAAFIATFARKWQR